ncbi:hypothetical protein [Cupriavidus oxalaticus]|uniref:Preprotein translocase subunit SecA n=1 Tax=Cupriavidus oxalaticus TaxID=96344 RepID=A0A976GBK8_9BURK|nr:hypothetical protein [Cupriavidus oxalaticus]QRQ86235.1 hypothetical protein JTE91_23790 [Cupriavidus oxalaticus]QRQ95438.1 hypothetical protein JTE92_18470 [Cupriavidus oxalaticus]WQD84097.1 hypothetical protein U0036_06180 [Cupriavidus oxalaticus]SPC17415.1 conserved hypothetical protein [Cupriavidus oxalaticus]
MLSPHEIAALMLLKDANETPELDPADLNALARKELVQMDRQAHQQGRVRLTGRGRQFLATIARRS